MHYITKKPRRGLFAGAAALILGLTLPFMAQAAISDTDQGTTTTRENQENTTARVVVHDKALDESAKAALSYCQENYPTCASATQNAAGILVFPSVVKADFIVGGAGGKGVLIEHGQITGYYRIGAGSVGAQLGVAKASQVYVFPTEASMQALRNGQSYWRVGGDLGVTVMAADVNVRDVTGKAMAFIFNSQGLQGGVSADLFDIWKYGTTRPTPGQG